MWPGITWFAWLGFFHFLQKMVRPSVYGSDRWGPLSCGFSVLHSAAMSVLFIVLFSPAPPSLFISAWCSKNAVTFCFPSLDWFCQSFFPPPALVELPLCRNLFHHILCCTPFFNSLLFLSAFSASCLCAAKPAPVSLSLRFSIWCVVWLPQLAICSTFHS